MKIHHLDLDRCDQAIGIAIVIDVIRAFTTAAIAFEKGARKIILVATPEQALRVRQENPGVLVMGEVGGLPPDGFDFGNSPSQLQAADLADRVLVQRTSSGTQGIVNCVHCKQIFAASFLTAQATVSSVIASHPSDVSIINTGARRDGLGDEDAACADYLEGLLLGKKLDPGLYTDRVLSCKISSVFKDPGRPEYPSEDLEICAQVDRCNFAIEVFREGDQFVGMRTARQT